MPFLTPNSLASLVQSALSTQSTRLGRAAHAQMIRTLDAPLPSFLSNHLVNMYSKLDLPDSAQLVLQLNPSRSVVTWTALIAGSVQNGHFASAILHFANMLRESVQPNDFTFPCAFKASGSLRLPATGKQVHALAVKAGQICDVFVGCSAFDMYCKTGLRDEARKVFDEMPERNLATWNAYMSNAVLDGRPLNAVYKFNEFLRAGGEPNSITFCAFLNACSDTSNLELGRQLHGFVMRCGFGKDVSVLNGLIDFYGKCREVGSSMMVFDTIDKRNDVSWCSLVAACVQNDEEEMACELFLRARKEGVEPTDFMVSSVLSACSGLAWLEQGSRAGAVETGMQIFESMKAKYGIEPGAEHYACVVDLLGRAGMVERAYEFITKMPIRPTISIWGALLGACKMYRKTELGRVAADKLFELDPKDSGNHVVLSNMFAAAGRWEEATLVRKEMKDVGIKKGGLAHCVY
ncbi:pentatricopeptide repeat-containing protein [Prunus yedoensis var. nudiflora]|uniref:Pentatricopeptide repeat-containing protein n=1 Tax=Prunus yedoensis var. nudiflora TaxID=2094558 RepID=A0A314U6C5_PRUYE|nr:pentatricopeptide repeat-containing protein [Prunus yedoensis var. nudiflora]